MKAQPFASDNDVDVSALHPDIIGLTIADVTVLAQSGVLSSAELTQKYMDRIEAIDHSGPCLSAVIEINPDSLAIATERDRERAEGILRGPLHGVPVLIKDNIDTADSMHTTAGSLALMNSTPTQDATIVSQLRAAGAVILGKTNLSEWANFRGNSSSSGWSARGGRTRNPHSLVRNPSGSSSGAAAAIPADLATISIGTETDGSIISPASACGVVGFKPTVGLTSRAGVIPISHSQDSVGVLARSVADIATTMSVVIASDPRDAATMVDHGVRPTDFLSILSGVSLAGVRLGVPTNMGFRGYSVHADRVFDHALEVLRSLGAEIVMPTDIPTAAALREFPGEIDRMKYEFRGDINAYLAERGDPEITSLADLIAFNNDHADQELAHFDQRIFIDSEAMSNMDKEQMEALHHRLMRLSRSEGIDAVLAQHNLDALIAVTKAPASMTDPLNGERSPGSASELPAIAGYPVITVPAGYVYGLPVGISFIGTAWSDARLLGFAHAWEQATRVYRAADLYPGDTVAREGVLQYELPSIPTPT